MADHESITSQHLKKIARTAPGNAPGQRARRGGRFMRLRNGSEISYGRPARIDRWICVVRARRWALAAGHVLARPLVVNARDRGRKGRGSRALLLASPSPPAQNSPLDTVTATGCDGMPLATTNSMESPSSISAGISTLVVTTAAPVATPIVVAEQAPEGPTEEHLVEELAGIIWRKRRLRMAEAAVYRGKLHDHAVSCFPPDVVAAAALLPITGRVGGKGRCSASDCR